MAHRQPTDELDRCLARTIDAAVHDARHGRLEIVLNGDIFDFDAPEASALEAGAVPPQQSHSELGAAALMWPILDDHPAVVSALTRAARSGAELVFVPGNHDAQVSLPSVQRVLRARLGRGIRFRSWFHRTPYGFHIEHGHQYDPTCSSASIAPTMNGIDHTLGSVSAYYAPALSAGMNPFVFDPLDVAPADALAGLRACLARVPNILTDYPETVVRMVRAIAGVTDRPRARVSDGVRAEVGATLDQAEMHRSLFAPGASLRTFIASGLWGSFVQTMEAKQREAMAQIARIYGSSGVVMGHTHRARAWTDDGRRYFANTGTWAPGAGVPRTYLWVTADASGIRPELREACR